MRQTNQFKKRTIGLDVNCSDKFLIGEQVGSRHIKSGEVTLLRIYETPLHHSRTSVKMIFVYCTRWIVFDGGYYFRLYFCQPRHCDEGKQDGDDGFLVHCSICL